MRHRRLRPRTSLSTCRHIALFRPWIERLMLLGKEVVLFADSNLRTHAELDELLASFNLTWLLRLIGEVRVALNEHELSTQITQYLDYVALVAVEVGNDSTELRPSRADLDEACQIVLSLHMAGNREDPFAFMMRNVHVQQTPQDLMYEIGRTSVLLETWNEVKQARDFDPSSAVLELFGMPFEQLLLCCFTYRSMGKQGFIALDGNYDDVLKLLQIASRDSKKFLKRLSATYGVVRSTAKAISSSRQYFRLNPLHKWPILVSDNAPEGSPNKVHLVPCPDLLLRRLTVNLIPYDLASHYKARSVQFRTSAGYVFEAYVGKLLQGSERNFAVHPERAYVKSGQEHLTPDWIVLENGRLVVVEAKFHGLVLEAKLSGAPSPDDLEKLARGCNQLLAFKTALLEEYEELRDYQNADGVELVLVTYDDIPSPNFAVAKALTDLGVRDIDQITICSIYDLERLLSHVELPLFHALNEKRCNQEYGQAELGDWLSAKVAHGKPHPLLESAWRRIHTSWNLPGSSELANSGLQQSVC